MNKKLLEKLKEKLKKERSSLEEQLQGFAEKDKKLKGDWDTKFPRFNGDSSASGHLEEMADEVEEYESLLSVEYALETRLRDVNLALKKIKKGKYGKCEKCGKKILEARLKVNPSARTCTKCK